MAPDIHEVSYPLLELSNTKVVTKGDCGVFRAVANCLALLIGLGVLSSPYAIAQAGWASLGINAVVAMAYLYTALLLVRCLEADPEMADYQDLGRKAFGKKGYAIAIFLLFGDLLSTLVGYGISLSDNLETLISSDIQKAMAGIFSDIFSSRALLTFLAVLIMLPTVWVRNLRSLAWVSASSVVSSVLVSVALVWLAFFADDATGVGHGIAPVRLDGLPVASGIFLFTYGTNIILPSIRTSLLHRSQFPKVLRISFLIATVFYGGIGVLGASMFGSNTESQITLNMPSGVIASKFAIWANILTALLKFSILLRPVAVEIEAVLPSTNHGMNTSSSKGLGLIPIVIRSTLVFILIVISLGVPFFAYVISLVGSSISVTLCLIFPCCIYWKLFSHEIHSLQKALLLFIILVASGAGIVGTANSIIGIYENSNVS